MAEAWTTCDGNSLSVGTLPRVLPARRRPTTVQDHHICACAEEAHHPSTSSCCASIRSRGTSGHCRPRARSCWACGGKVVAQGCGSTLMPVFGDCPATVPSSRQAPRPALGEFHAPDAVFRTVFRQRSGNESLPAAMVDQYQSTLEARHDGQSHCHSQNHSHWLLHEMQDHARDHECQADHDEEWPASDRRDLPGVQHQDVQNRRQQVSLRE